ncbi:hypothetical protein [Alkalicoccus chagannorensis]|uniref:hypothetical protein n=1 Tax=Alkalicoccus chagannorensis TaxID=427072 RepID=UPI000422FE1B|nr:hypothetical protein [Alkalicoccus chagannorensis]
MNVSRHDVQQLLESMNEDELRIVYTFIQEFRIAEKDAETSDRTLSTRQPS